MKDQYDKTIEKTLYVNMGYKTGEKVAIIGQRWSTEIPDTFKAEFLQSSKLCERINGVFSKLGVDTNLFFYTPTEYRNGADVSPDLYERIGAPDILFLVTVFSLTHTSFRRYHSERGARIASMPGFKLDLFSGKGPMSLDYNLLDEKTKKVAEKLRQSEFVRVTAYKTDITIQIDRKNIHVSSGLLSTKGAWGNLPGAEAYVPPIHKGISNGFFTVPKGWGGTEAVPGDITFFVEDGCIIRVFSEDKETQKYIENKIHPQLFEKPGYNVLAELGIGTNTAITKEFIKKTGWSTLTAEKIGGSAHFANGNSFSMGGGNNVPIHIDWVVPDALIEYEVIPKN